jgi:hypothetical protein
VSIFEFLNILKSFKTKFLEILSHSDLKTVDNFTSFVKLHYEKFDLVFLSNFFDKSKRVYSNLTNASLINFFNSLESTSDYSKIFGDLKLSVFKEPGLLKGIYDLNKIIKIYGLKNDSDLKDLYTKCNSLIKLTKSILMDGKYNKTLSIEGEYFIQEKEEYIRFIEDHERLNNYLCIFTNKSLNGVPLLVNFSDLQRDELSFLYQIDPIRDSKLFSTLTRIYLKLKDLGKRYGVEEFLEYSDIDSDLKTSFTVVVIRGYPLYKDIQCLKNLSKPFILIRRVTDIT